ncbi:MAG: TIGR00159 family protein [Clostridiales bacterium]|jgi:diadenylate cyclase|nr:TIGR00159 family protein [Clostridiales bacterium]
MGIADKLLSIFQPVADVFATLRFSDFLDICLVTFVLYSAIKLIRDTRTIQLIKGIMLMGVIYLFISALNMQASTYIFDKMFSNIFLVLIVIFQPEIRHAVESMGRTRILSVSSIMARSEQIKQNRITIETINHVCKACSEMSDRKIGALLVFERETLLGEIIETGTLVDAKVSGEIISNIFYPKAPLHDGAAVIRNNKLYAAGCILPLTQNHDNIESELGTRHRAALGMSEQSDALVVVISEENGYISSAFKGGLKRNISDGELREILGDMLLIKESKGEGEKGSRLKNLLSGGRK